MRKSNLLVMKGIEIFCLRPFPNLSLVEAQVLSLAVYECFIDGFNFQRTNGLVEWTRK